MHQRWLMIVAAGRWHRFPPVSPPTQILGPCSVSFISDWVSVRVRQCINPQPCSRHFGLLTVQTMGAPGGVPYGTITGPRVTFMNNGLGTTMSKCEVKPSAAHCSYKGPLYFQSRLRKTLMQHIYVCTVNTCQDTPDVPDEGEINNKHPS